MPRTTLLKPCGVQMPEFTMLHTLSMSRSPITSLRFSARGDWLALGSAALGQLLVWDWRAETYVLRQQGHHHEASALAFSPDGGMLASGADDAKVGWDWVGLCTVMRRLGCMPAGWELGAADVVINAACAQSTGCWSWEQWCRVPLR